MALFTYHVPHDVTYNAHDIAKILNNDWVHSTLAKGKGSFYSSGTTAEAMVIPALVGTALLFTAAVITAAVLDDSSSSKKSYYGGSTNNYYFFNSGSGHNYKYTDLDIPDNYYTPEEVVYMLNTHDVWGTLHHQVPINYQVPLSGDAWHYAAVLD